MGNAGMTSAWTKQHENGATPNTCGHGGRPIRITPTISANTSAGISVIPTSVVKRSFAPERGQSTTPSVGVRLPQHGMPANPRRAARKARRTTAGRVMPLAIAPFIVGLCANAVVLANVRYAARRLSSGSSGATSTISIGATSRIGSAPVPRVIAGTTTKRNCLAQRGASAGSFPRPLC